MYLRTYFRHAFGETIALTTYSLVELLFEKCKVWSRYFGILYISSGP